PAVAGDRTVSVTSHRDRADAAAAITADSSVSASYRREGISYVAGVVEGDGQGGDTVYKGQVVERQRAGTDGHAKASERCGQRPQGYSQLHLAQLGAHTPVHTVAERQIAMLAPRRVKRIGVITKGRITVSATQRAQHHIAGGDARSAKFHLVAGDPRKRHLDDREVSQ